MQSGAEERCFSEMASVCPIDEKCASQVSSLLQPPSSLQDYFDNLISTRPSQGIKVHQNTHLGKGVYAEVDFREEELVLKDQMLVGIQHSSNKVDCLVCSFCFRFIGSIELQIGRKLYLQNLGVSANDCCDMETSSHVSNNCFDTVSSDMEDESQVKNHQNLENCASSSSKDNISLPNGVVESLMNGELVLPYSNKFPIAFCCFLFWGMQRSILFKSCAETDWELFHSILCTGERSESPSREALSKFIQHANGTNDIFLLAAKAISFTILRYRKLEAAHQGGKHTSPDALDGSDLSLLLEAWKPISMGYKRRWWDCIALPDDVDYSDEASFRKQIKELAFTKEAELVTRPILDSLGDDYSICCQGTAFFPLQSCMNHSCCPNAKAFKREEDRDGQATIIACRPISKGEEVTISYIDEDLPYEERQALLADYGFKCRCPKCLKEES
ncbi:hypothetical protein Patl1_02063 [Pistacia atlantica]|uniref:Uncharacterized protein n=1 Tax=Pistacia atlantica TaxID=434234 RepID=A0ACC1CCV2_9ROSI|nr:hypothetical protein Patl1_02063 [Pistacia atlantica]